LFGAPPEAGEPRRWGFKEVRLSADYALYLEFLFPRAKFIFLVRDPLTAFASYKSWRTWYRRWPDEQVRTADGYARMWRQLAGSFWARQEAGGLNALLLRYEDLMPGNPAIARIEEFLGSPVDGSVLERRIRGSDAQRAPLTSVERLVLRRRTRAVARRFAYPGPPERG
jgi:hypothetical protein